jgi:3-oxoadipate enol-lactonase
MVSMAWRAGRYHEVAIPGRGRVAVRDSGGPPGAPALVLLHGVTLTADLNWAAVVPALSAHFRVLSLDLPGHGRGLRSPGRFRLEDCADDVAAVADALGIRQLVPVGYSMGGLIAQLLWRRHPDRTAGLVLCSTARNVSGSLWESSVALMMPGVLATAAWAPPLWPLRADVVGGTLLDGVPDPATRRWALEQMRRTSLLEALSAVDAASRFTSHRWIGTVDVPTAVVVTGRDRVVPPGRQRKLAAAVPGCLVHEIDAGHGAFIGSPAAFAATLLRACTSVVEQAAGGRAESAS